MSTESLFPLRFDSVFVKVEEIEEEKNT